MTAPLPVWRQFLGAALENRRDGPHNRYAQIATVRPDGRPANRTLVFRSFLDPDNQLVFTADLRSDKAAQIGANAWTEVCWYFVSAREQFRVAGRAAMFVGDGGETLSSARMRIWRELSDSSRQTFTWPQPGAPRASSKEFRRVVKEDPPAHFALFVVTPQQVDHLRLVIHPHERTLHTRLDGDRWTSEAINP